MFRKMPVILLAMILVIGIFHPWIPPFYQSLLYGISLSLKSLIVFILPFLIFGLLCKTAMQLAKQASKWIILLLVGICISNFCSTMISYLIGHTAYQFDLSLPVPQETLSLMPIGDFSLPKLFNNSYAMIAGLVIGLFLGIFKPQYTEKFTFYIEKCVGVLLRMLLYIIPLFIVGFIVKMLYDGVMGMILRNYGPIFILVVGAVFSYVGFIYWAVHRFDYQAAIQSIKNMLPATIVAFSSMSSAVAMPLTILGVEKNTKGSDAGRSIIPATVNVHLIGDCFAIPVFAFAIMKSFGFAEPSMFNYLIFALYFVLAKFSVASVPGGGILVMLPVLETYLGFTGEMLSLITTLYILFDPVITAANVLGNGGVAIGAGHFLNRNRTTEA